MTASCVIASSAATAAWSGYVLNLQHDISTEGSQRSVPAAEHSVGSMPLSGTLDAIERWSELKTKGCVTDRGFFDTESRNCWGGSRFVRPALERHLA